MVSIGEAIMGDKVIQYSAPPDEERWYQMQRGQWFYVLACCRPCATRKLNDWVGEFGLTTRAYPPWLFRAEDVG